MIGKMSNYAPERYQENVSDEDILKANAIAWQKRAIADDKRRKLDAIKSDVVDTYFRRVKKVFTVEKGDYDNGTLQGYVGLLEENLSDLYLEDVISEILNFLSETESDMTLDDAGNIVYRNAFTTQGQINLLNRNELQRIAKNVIRLEARRRTNLTLAAKKVNSCITAHTNKVNATREELAKDRIRTLLPPTDKAFIGEIVRYVDRLKEYLKRGTDYLKSHQEYLREIGRYATSIASFETFNTIADTSLIPRNSYFGFGLSTPCVLWMLPLRHVQTIEVARSGKILKFRADGSVFLAQQEGAEDAIRIEFLIHKEEIIYLLAIWGLFLYGRQEFEKIENLAGLGVGGGNIWEVRKLGDISKFNLVDKKPFYEYHRTFPLITRHIIVPNVYIETVSYEDRVVDGYDIIRCTLMLRTYRKPREFVKSEIDEDNILIGIKPDRTTKIFDAIEFSANMAWRISRFLPYFVHEGEWKISNAGKTDDVYYDIGIDDIASTVAMASMGFIL